MALLSFTTKETNINFVSWRIPAFILSLTLVLASIALVMVRGLNFGIDFKGGILLEIETPNIPDIAGMRSAIGNLNLGDFSLQEFGAANVIMIRLQTQEGGEAGQVAAMEKVKQVLPAGSEYRRTEFVGPTVGGELIAAGVKALVFSTLAILVYIWVRFEWQFGLGAVVSLLHDVIVTIGFFSLMQIDFNLSTVAAILTIAGYSINDTVIVYDRIREELRKFKKMPLDELINYSLNRTLSRTILTSTTTLLALLSLYFLGGDVISSFALAMILGIIIGTYSSIYIAAPLLLYTGIRKDKGSSPAPAAS